MKLRLVSILLFALAITVVSGKPYFIPFNKSDYYSAIASQNIETINNEIEIVKASSTADKDAYEGTLLMMKAGLVKKIPDKISLFRSGRMKLETSIKHNNENTELRFLRLMVQENAPLIVNYKSDLDKDKAFIENHFSTLTADVQKCILDYSKRSKILNPKDF